MADKTYLGIDIGSVCASVVLADQDMNILQTAYIYHQGQIEHHLGNILSNFDGKNLQAVSITSSTPQIINHANSFDNRVCFITASKYFFPEVNGVLIVGGEKFGLALFDKDGNYKTYKSNSSCAAGTGSFLDQQTRRLNLANIEEFNQLAFDNKGNFPKIASRCAVFAKTDLIHAQQEGYTLPEICDGLCHGLARNIVDTVFSNAHEISSLVFTGGVSQNKAVIRHIKSLTGLSIRTHQYGHLFGAIGAIILLLENKDFCEIPVHYSMHDLIDKPKKKKSYFYPPLQLQLTNYPDFSTWKSYKYESKLFTYTSPVETDLYVNFKELKNLNVYLGIDIGSTSTKAILLDNKKNVLAGFYTRTSGKPVIAIQTIFEAIDQLRDEYRLTINISGSGTTGSGRKFIGKIIGADQITDEISAHARAAVELDPDVDTIIEIGGQDSKFTTLKNGMVTFSVMNNVCAAGTGSFIEEQALKLGVPLSEYSTRAENQQAPMTSDRCTVFMERDINHYQNENYDVDELLASVLHSVRENYLSKVALQSAIGNKIFFQGATAKNKALVSAFEQKLGKPVMVSKYCHLTGALGVALELHSLNIQTDKFRGLDLYKHSIPVHAEICELCTNHCKLNIAEVNGAKVAYGFLCGRDYDDNKFIENNTSGFDLLKAYKQVYRFEADKNSDIDICIGLPATLYMWEDLFFWKCFFNHLKIKTISSENCTDALLKGKMVSGAEFCAPITSMQGHILYLSAKTNYIFMPVYIEEKQKNSKRRRLYCYYTQYAASIAASIPNKNIKLISPVLKSLQNKVLLIFELYKSLSQIFPGLSILEVSSAYESARQEKKKRKSVWMNLYHEHSDGDNNLKVALVGRPYTVLSSALNNKIPSVFSRLGIKTFFQDMLPVPEKESNELKELLDAFKWNYAAQIISATDFIAKTENLYPVMMTSFKCTPDAFVIEYFKQIMEAHGKPYLILQLDEHGSNVGYETRIEAAVRSFRNHNENKNTSNLSISFKTRSSMIKGVSSLKNKTLLMPNWDDFAVRLLVSTLRHAGIDARALKDTNSSIQRSLVYNTGQCIPLNIIMQDAIDYIKENKLKPENTAIWMINSGLACNLSMFPHYMAKVLKSLGNGFEKVKIYLSDISFVDISMNTSINVYLAYMFGGYLRKIVLKLRPYELVKGETDRIAEKAIEYLCKTIENGESREEALKVVIPWFEAIKIKKEQRPKVAIFGDLYARDNEVVNQDLVRLIEDNGGEAITTPYSEYLKIISSPYLTRAFKEGRYLNAATMKFLRNIIPFVEAKYFKYFQHLIDEKPAGHISNIEEKLDYFNVKISNGGESLENLLKIFHIVSQHPDLTLFVQTSPAYCCPSLVTESMSAKIEEYTGIPIVSIEYDGTMSKKNEDVIPFLKLAQNKRIIQDKDVIFSTNTSNIEIGESNL
ncbi:MAG: acyl-CoA dehydratase activase [Bacteroidales bacterium]